MAVICFRKAGKKDLKRVKGFLKAVDRDFYPYLSEREPLEKTASKIVLGKNHTCILAEHSGDLIGIGAYQMPWKGRKDAYIKVLALSPGARGMGVGTRLRKEVIKRVETCGAKEVYATTWSTNSRMIHINRKMGFRVHKIVKNDRGPGIHTIFFKKSLK